VIRALTSILLVLFSGAACTSSAGPAHDPGKVVQPERKVAVSGRLYATKHRTLYRFSGTAVTPLLRTLQVKDPAVSADGSRIAFSLLQGQSSSIVVADSTGQSRRTLTPSSAPEGRLWAFSPAFSGDGQQVAYLTDRGKLRSNPKNLQPNDLGLWICDTTTGDSTPLMKPIAYTGGDSDPSYRPSAAGQLIYTTYLYGGQPLEPVARLTWLSMRSGTSVYLSPEGARNFQPAVSPDGRFLAFVHAEAGRDDLFVMPLAATYSREPHPYPTASAVLVQSGIVSQPVWSPDGKAIAFMMLAKGSFDLFTIPLNTSGPITAAGAAVPITHGSFLDADSRLAWSP
jgi:TolB protein